MTAPAPSLYSRRLYPFGVEWFLPLLLVRQGKKQLFVARGPNSYRYGDHLHSLANTIESQGTEGGGGGDDHPPPLKEDKKKDISEKGLGGVWRAMNKVNFCWLRNELKVTNNYFMNSFWVSLE